MTKKMSKKQVTLSFAFSFGVPLGGIAYIYFSQFESILIDVAGTVGVTLVGFLVGYMSGLLMYKVGKRFHPDKWEP